MDTAAALTKRFAEKLRIALDLPSRAELAELTARLEALDARISSLAAERVAEMSKTVPTLPEPPVEEDPEAKKKPTKTKR